MDGCRRRTRVKQENISTFTFPVISRIVVRVKRLGQRRSKDADMLQLHCFVDNDADHVFLRHMHQHMHQPRGERMDERMDERRDGRTSSSTKRVLHSKLRFFIKALCCICISLLCWSLASASLYNC